MKRISTLLLALVAVMSLFSSEKIGNLYYDLYYNPGNDLGRYAIVTYQNTLASNYSGLTKVEIPQKVGFDGYEYTVIGIGEQAFKRARNLTTVECGLNVTEIGKKAFDRSAVTTVKIMNKTVSIGDSAFYYCGNLQSVYIGQSVTSFGKDVFLGCSELTSVEWDAANYPDFKKSTDNPFYAFREQISSFTFGSQVESIPDYLCEGMNGMTSVQIPGSVTRIGSYAFSSCKNLVSVTFGDNVSTISSSAFANCTGLTSLELPSGLTKINTCAFQNCTGLTAITCHATTPPTVNTDAFKGLESRYFRMRLYVPHLSRTAYENAGVWKKFGVVNSIKPVVARRVKVNDLYYDLYPDYTAYVVAETTDNDNYKGLAQIAIPPTTYYNAETYSVTGVEFYAFSYCSSLELLTVGLNITKFDGDALRNCDNLTSVVWNARNCADFSLNNTPFYQYKNKYESNTVCRQITIFSFGSQVEYIPAYLCEKMSLMTKFTIPDNVTGIGDGVFTDCEKTVSVLIGNKVQKMGTNVFSNCQKLTDVTIPKSVTSISGSLFKSCYNLESVTVEDGNPVYDSRNKCNAVIETATNTLIAGCGFTGFPESLTAIGKGAFESVTSLTRITIPKNLTKIDAYAFQSCKGVKDIVSYAVTPPTLGSNVFYGLTCSEIPLYVPKEGLETYRSTAQWKEFNVKVTGATEHAKIGDLYYNLFSDGTAFVVADQLNESNYAGLTNATIPATVTYKSKTYSVTAIEKQAFANCKSLQTVTISAGVTTIGTNAFKNCTGVKSITCEAVKVPVTGEEVFAGLVCTDIVLFVPEGSLTAYRTADQWNEFYSKATGSVFSARVKIGDLYYELFDDDHTAHVVAMNFSEKNYSGLTNANIPATVTYDAQTYRVTGVDDEAFVHSSGLKTLSVGENISSIGDAVLYGCKGLTTIVWNAKNCTDFAYYETIGDQNYYSTLTARRMKDGKNYDLTEQITSFTFGKNVEYIPSYLCWYLNKLTSLTLPSSATGIGKMAFSHATGLGAITVPAEVTVIEESVFAESDVNAITLHNGITTIGNLAFASCPVTSIHIPKSVTSIGKGVFANCPALTDIRVNKDNPVYDSRNDCKAIIETATNLLVSGCNNTVMPDNISGIEDYAFFGCDAITSVTLPQTVVNIGNKAFANCTGLVSADIHAVNIGNYAFYECGSLSSVTFSENLESIGEAAFYGCKAVTSVSCNAVVPPTLEGDYIFFGVNCANTPLYVPVASRQAYKSAYQWNEFAIKVAGTKEHIQIGDLYYDLYPDKTAYVVADVLYTLDNYTGLTKAVVPETVTYEDETYSVTGIDNSAFHDCSTLETLSVGENVTFFGELVLQGCTGLTTVVWNAKNCADFNEYASPFFRVIDGINDYNLTENITSFTFGDAVEHIPANLCSYLSKLGELTIPESVTSIGEYAFYNVTGLGEVVLPAGVTVLEKGVFMASDLKAITLHEGVKEIKDEAFCWTDLESYVLCKATEPPIMGKDVFYYVYCSNIPLYVPFASLEAYQNADQWKEFNPIKAFDPHFLITFANWDGKELQKGYVLEGTIPEYAGTTPERPANEYYSYTFNGWTPELTAVTEDATYTATFKAEERRYTVTWKDWDGTELAKETYVYGAKPAYKGTEPTRLSTAEYDYAFMNWTPDVLPVTGDATYTAEYDAQKRIYTVTWKMDDGTVIADESYPYGETPSRENPVKAATVEHTFTFTGWNPEIAAVTGDAVYTATFLTEDRSYTVTWQNWDGTELAHETYTYGTTPSYKGAEPTRPATIEHTFTFNGWSPTIAPVAGDVTYKAQYTSSGKTYTVIWKMDDGTELAKETYVYGETPSHENPVKAATAQYNYTFSGWSPAVEKVSGDATYTATFKAEERSYTVTWKDWDGTELAKETYVYGTTPKYKGTDPERAATAEHTFAFNGWSPAVADVTGDAVYTAEYKATVNNYTVTWKMDDGSLIEKQTYAYGETPSHENPVKAATAQYNYTFTGWTPAVGKVTGDVTYTAVFKAEERSYTVTWKNWDGTTLDEVVYVYGSTPKYNGAEPARPATAQFTYSFTGWSPAVATVTGEVTYTAVFKQTTNNYTVTWKMDDGTVLAEETYAYGETPSRENPVKAATAQYNYTFTGWSPAVTAVSGDVAYTAVFKAEERSYTVTWTNWDGTELAHETYTYGATPAYKGATPARPATIEHTFTFTGWSPVIAPVNGDVTYKAQFSSSGQTYTVTWKMDDGTVIANETYAYGDMPTREAPTKAQTPQYSYSFSGWTPTVAAVTGDATYTATFKAEQRSYTVIWKNWDGAELAKETYVYGAKPAYKGDTPARPATAQFSYTFTGWNPEVAEVTGDAAYTAVFQQTTNNYTVTWKMDDGSVIEKKTYAYGEMPSHDNPVKAATAQYSYTFTGWTPAITAVSEDATYTAVFKAEERTYTVTWTNWNSIQLAKESYTYGAIPAYSGATPARPATAQFSYTFTGWSPTVAAVTGDVTYTAVFKETTNSYTVTWKMDDGSVIAKETYAYGEKPSHENPVKAATTQYNYTFTGWNPEVATVSGDAVYTAVFKAEERSYTVTWTNWDGTELAHETYVYGSEPKFKGAEPTRPATAENTFTFTGWSPAIVPVAGDVTYKAQFSATGQTYTVTWKMDDGTVIAKETYAYGDMPSHEAPTKAQTPQYTYSFSGWSPALAAVSEDATYTAVFKAEERSYTVIWKNWDGAELAKETYVYGAKPAYKGDTPARPATAQFTYAFTGWNPEIGEVTGDAAYTAVFKETKNSYTVTWKMDDGSVIAKETYAYGEIPSRVNPVKPATPQYIYTFAGWDPVVEHVTKDATYTATFKAEERTYTVTWTNWDGTTLAKETYTYGATPAYKGATPARPETAQYTYSFTGWSPAIVPVAEDVTYKAQFNQAGKSYTVTWKMDDGTLIAQETYAYGEKPSRENPVKAATVQYNYTFTGWNPEVAAVTGDATYTATFKAEERSYTVTWVNWDGTELAKETYAYGSEPKYKGDTPARPATAENTFTFNGWSPTIVPVAADVTYKAQFSATGQTYTVTWKMDDGTVIANETYAYGDMPSHEAPTKEQTVQYTYSFSGWSPDLTAVTADVTYTAVFKAEERSYTVTWVNWDGTELAKETYAYGSEPKYKGDTPARPETEQYTYTFTGWSPALGPVTGDVTYKAQFSSSSEGKIYTVIFLDRNGDVIDKQEVAAGEAAVAPDAPVVEGYTFTGWDKAFDHITANLTVTAQYVENNYMPTNLKAVLLPKDDDLLITLSWDKVAGAASYELRMTVGGKELFSQNTMGLNVIAELLSNIEKQYKIDGGTYTVDWAVRSTDMKGKAISDWAAGPQFQITIKGSGTGIDEVESQKSKVESQKILLDNKVYILRGEHLYDVTGKLVK